MSNEHGPVLPRPAATDRQKVAVLGLGYVGLPVALAAAGAGHDVVGFDVAESRIAEIRAGRSELVDLDHDDLARRLASGSLTVTADRLAMSACEVFVLCVPTPLRDGRPDLSMLEGAVDTVAAAIRPGALVVVESTTWPGTTREVVVPRLAERSGFAPEDVDVVFSPERIDPGNARYPLARIPKLVGGITPAAAKRAARFYRTFIDLVHIMSGPSEAELAKILENTFRHVNLALVNELAVLCSDTGIDLREAIDAAATKPFGYMPFYPGPGVGGHCIPVDPMYLMWQARRSGHTLQLIEVAEQINRSMPQHVVSRAGDVLNDVGKPVRGSRVLLLGVSYKPNVADVRESSAGPIVDRLLSRGAFVHWHDPLVRASFTLPGAPRIPALDPAPLLAADLVVLHTPHEEYLGTASWLAGVDAPVLDAHGALRGRGLPAVFGL